MTNGQWLQPKKLVISTNQFLQCDVNVDYLLLKTLDDIQKYTNIN